MKQVYKFYCEDKNKYILIEIKTTELGGLVRASRDSKEYIEGKKSLHETILSVQPLFEILEQILDKVGEIKKDINVTFGMKVSSEGETIVTAGQDEANFIFTIHHSPIN